MPTDTPAPTDSPTIVRRAIATDGLGDPERQARVVAWIAALGVDPNSTAVGHAIIDDVASTVTLVLFATGDDGRKVFAGGEYLKAVVDVPLTVQPSAYGL